MFKKEEKIGIAFSGAFFDKQFLLDFLLLKLGGAVADECEEDIMKMFSTYLEMIEFEPTVGELFLLDAADFKEYKDKKKWFIGVHLKNMPERMSKKRFNIEVREMLTKCRIVDEKEADVNLVKFIFDTITVRY